MKNRLIIIVSLIIFSCNNKEQTNPEFDFTININVENGEDLELFLYLPSQGLDNRIKAKVKNGKLVFNGKAQAIENAQLRFEADVDKNSYSLRDVFTEPNGVDLDIKIGGDLSSHYISDVKVRKGKVNLHYYNNSDTFWDAYSTMLYSDLKKADSMRKFVYPNIKTNVLKVYDSLLNTKENSAASLLYLTFMVETGRGDVFNINHLTLDEKQKLNQYFNNINKSLKNTPNYRTVKSRLERMNNLSNEMVFKDFELKNDKDEMIRLSEVIKKNNKTVLYFWNSGCAPCRLFNKETHKEYENLKAKGIEIISINSDESREKWLKSSNKDTIVWTNLHAGAMSNIELYYNITYYPTKFVLDNEMNSIDFKFKTVEELLKIK